MNGNPDPLKHVRQVKSVLNLFAYMSGCCVLFSFVVARSNLQWDDKTVGILALCSITYPALYIVNTLIRDSLKASTLILVLIVLGGLIAITAFSFKEIINHYYPVIQPAGVLNYSASKGLTNRPATSPPTTSNLVIAPLRPDTDVLAQVASKIRTNIIINVPSQLTIPATNLSSDAGSNKSVEAPTNVVLMPIKHKYPPPILSAISCSATNLGTNTNMLTVSGGNLEFFCTATDPSGLPITWQWVYSINGGPENIYSKGSGTTASASYSNSVNNGGSVNVWSLQAYNGFSSATSSLSVFTIVPPPEGMQIIANPQDLHVTPMNSQ